MPQPPTSLLAQFAVQCSNAAQRLGIKTVVIAARDPVTNQTDVIASPGAMEDLRPVLGEKLGLNGPDESETAWPG